MTLSGLTSAAGRPPFDPAGVKRILVKKLGGLGNVVMGTPMLAQLGETFPSARITVLVQSEAASQALAGLPFVHETIVIPVDRYRARGPIGFLAAMLGMALKMRRARYDLVVNSYGGYGGGSWLSACLTYVMGGRWRVGYGRRPWSGLYSRSLAPEGDIHEVDRNVALVELLGPGSGRSGSRLMFALGPEEVRKAADLLAEHGISAGDFTVGIHPGCGPLKFKRWAPGRFAELADRLSADYGARVVLFGGPEEGELAGEIASIMDTKPLNLAGRTGLKLAAALISRMNVFISNDTGLMHVAAALGVPVVAVFGPSDYRRTAPYGAGHAVVRADLDCIPCYRGRGPGCDEITCLDRVTVGEVLDAALSVRKPPGSTLCA
jgi:heptosyltransferase-2